MRVLTVDPSALVSARLEFILHQETKTRVRVGAQSIAGSLIGALQGRPVLLSMDPYQVYRKQPISRAGVVFFIKPKQMGIYSQKLQIELKRTAEGSVGRRVSHPNRILGIEGD